MRKIIFLVEILLLVLAGIAAFVSTNLHSPIFASEALIFISLYLFVTGGDALVTKKMGFFPKNPNFGRTETYQGLTAQLWGGIFIFLAIFPLVFAILNLTLKGGMLEFWAKMLDTNWGWGIILVSIGLVVMTTAIIRLIAGSGGYYTGWQDRIEQITGIIPTVFGLALVILGIFLFLFPDQLRILFDRAVNLIK